jgi:ABC-2 type transport system ATP-binding protein
MSEGELAVEVRDLVVRFGDFAAIGGVSFQVPRGEIFGFLGANGAGKTTTIRVLCGLLVPTEGYVRVAGKGFEDGEMAIKSKVGYMSQKFTLYNDLTVGENLSFIASLRKLDKDVFERRKRELFEFISFDRRESDIVQDLPGGTKQHVSLAASMLHDPEIVFLDEPTAGVTPVSRARFWNLIRALSKQGKTVFVTTHYMDEAEQCQRIALMRAGKLIGLDTPAGLKASTFPGEFYEFDPRESVSFAEITSLRSLETFSYFETYGLRFHAAIKDTGEWEKKRPELERKFKITAIKPTLEDVFIQSVEGGNR